MLVLKTVLLNPEGMVVLSLFTKGVVWDDNIFVGGGLVVLPFGNMLLLWIGEVNGRLLSPTVSLKSFFWVCCMAILEPIMLEPNVREFVLLLFYNVEITVKGELPRGIV